MKVFVTFCLLAVALTSSHELERRFIPLYGPQNYGYDSIYPQYGGGRGGNSISNLNAQAYSGDFGVSSAGGSSTSIGRKKRDVNLASEKSTAISGSGGTSVSSGDANAYGNNNNRGGGMGGGGYPSNGYNPGYSNPGYSGYSNPGYTNGMGFGTGAGFGTQSGLGYPQYGGSGLGGVRPNSGWNNNPMYGGYPGGLGGLGNMGGLGGLGYQSLGNVNSAKQSSVSVSGDGGTSVSSGSANAGRRRKRAINKAEQNSQAVSGISGTSVSDGSAQATGGGRPGGRPDFVGNLFGNLGHFGDRLNNLGSNNYGGWNRPSFQPSFNPSLNVNFPSVNIAQQHSESYSGAGGTSISSGNAASTGNNRPHGGVNIADQSSKSVSGAGGVSVSSGSATAGSRPGGQPGGGLVREKRTSVAQVLNSVNSKLSGAYSSSNAGGLSSASGVTTSNGDKLSIASGQSYASSSN